VIAFETLQNRARAAFPALDRAGLGVVDVGARDGLHAVFAEVAGLVDGVGFEPDAEECRRLNAAGAAARYRSLVFLPVGLGGTSGRRALHVCRSRGSSSLYRPERRFLDRFPDSARFAVESEPRVPVRPLDDVVDDPSLGMTKAIDFAKLDTQGSELEILQGARKTLDRIVAVEVEVEFARMYEAQPVFRDVDAFLAERGFTLFKLRRQEWVRSTLGRTAHWSAGQLVFGDALYLRDPLGAEGWVPEDARQAEALVLIAILYDLHDFALELVTRPPIAGLVDAGAVRAYVEARSRRLASPWGRGTLVLDVLRAVKAAVSSHRYRRYDAHWARSDGNFYTRIR
jgi:FkbM family methyltransferase